MNKELSPREILLSSLRRLMVLLNERLIESSCAFAHTNSASGKMNSIVPALCC